ncbi:MAG: hypothetical protein M1489_03990 [Firmicutes bacterium]|nr:hypothetical protein [Bacillota bacterium]
MTLTLLQAVKQRTKARQHIAGERDNLSETDVLIGLIRVIYPEFSKPVTESTFKTNTSEYKKCKISAGTYLPFGVDSVIDSFDDRVKNEYHNPLKAMTTFVNNFLEIGTSADKDKRLVKALIELVADDESIEENRQFYSSVDGQPLLKNELVALSEVCLQSFLLGIWHFILVNRKDNLIGAATYLKWHKPPEEPRGKWIFIGPNGVSVTRNIKINIIDAPIENEATSTEPVLGAQPTEQSPDVPKPVMSPKMTVDGIDPKRITVNNFGTVQNQKFISIETMNGDINL